MNDVVGNFHAIPHVFTPEEVCKIMYAFALWHRPLPDAEEDDWMLNYFAIHPERRSVTETMANWTRNPQWQRIRTHAIMPVNIEVGARFAFRVWTGENTPASILEEAQQILNEDIARANQMMFGD
jgi:ABC-type glycerol-3-phosphate transport system substrate-binding protein